MTDRALDVAKFMVDEVDGINEASLESVFSQKFRDLSRKQIHRGLRIARNRLVDIAVEHRIEPTALRAELSRRLSRRAA